MPLIQWTSDFSVGVESIDIDHKLLVSLINQLDDAIKSGEPRETITRVLNALLDYTSYHFGREEALMEACGYPDLDAHIRTHNTLKAQVTEIRNRYLRHPDSIHDREVLAFLQNWLTAHIMGRDKLYSPYMESRKEDVREAERAYAHAVEQPAGKVQKATG